LPPEDVARHERPVSDPASMPHDLWVRALPLSAVCAYSNRAVSVEEPDAPRDPGAARSRPSQAGWSNRAIGERRSDVLAPSCRLTPHRRTQPLGRRRKGLRPLIL
jgi:hypothetical protein